MPLSIEVLDLSDHHVYRDFYRAYAAAQVPKLSHPYAEHELSIELIGNEFLRFDPIFALEGEEIVGVAIAECPLKDNATTAFVEVFVLPDRRREGIGSALLKHLEFRCYEDGRDQMLAETLRRTDEEISCGGAFFAAHGYQFDTLYVQSELDLPVPVMLEDSPDGFELLSWRGLPPLEVIDAYARLRALLNQEAPSGETQLDNEFWDASRLRAENDEWHRQRRTAVTVVAIDGNGDLVGHTQLVFPSGAATAFQWDTLVLPQYRGHGLGQALKRRALAEADELLDPCHRIVTWNDASNEHMLRINRELGYRQTAWLDQWVKQLAVETQRER